ncbi:MAG TPA: helix-turn-helix transcriptional regulator [Pseudolabrys sp.]
MITIEQLRAARALLRWSQTDLANQAGLSVPTVKRLEGGFGPHVSDEAQIRLQKTLERAGISFIDENGGGPGVRLSKRQRAKKPR